MIATYHGHANIVKVLIDRGADIDIADCFGKKAKDRAKDNTIIRLIERADNKSTYSASKSASNKKTPSRQTSPQRSPQSSAQKKLASTLGSGFSKTSLSKAQLTAARIGVETSAFMKTQTLSSPQNTLSKFEKQSSFSSVIVFLFLLNFRTPRDRSVKDPTAELGVANIIRSPVA